MTNKRFNYSILFFLFFIIQSAQLVSAQHATITGKVNGGNPESLPVVRLCNSADSTLVKAAICDSSGNFEIEIAKTGTFLIIIDQLDYQKFIGQPFDLQFPQGLFPVF